MKNFIRTPLDAVRAAVHAMIRMNACGDNACDKCTELRNDVRECLEHWITKPAGVQPATVDGVIGYPVQLTWHSAHELLQMRADFEANLTLSGTRFAFLVNIQEYAQQNIQHMWLGFQLGRTPPIEPKQPCSVCLDTGEDRVYSPPRPCTLDGCTAYADHGFCEDEGCDHHGTVHTCTSKSDQKL
jgi:hypothetical protein